MVDKTMSIPSRMSVGKKIIKNFLSLIVGNVISKLLTFLAFVYIARVLGPALFGKINFVQAISLYFLILTHLGLTLLGTREIAHDRSHVTRYVNEIFTIRLLLSIVSFIILIVFAYLIKLPNDTRMLIVLFGFTLMPMALYLDWAFKGLELMEYIGICEALKAIILYVLTIILIKNPKGLYLIPLIFIISSFIGSAFLFGIYIHRQDHFSMTLSRNSIKSLIYTALPLGISFIMIQVYYQMGVIILGFVKGDVSVAWYNASYKIVLFIIAFAGYFIDSIFPIIARYYRESIDKLKVFSNMMTKLTVSFAIPIGVMGTILAPQIIYFFYGSEYNKSVTPFRFLIWTSVVILISMNYGTSLIACHKEKKYLIGVTIGATTNVILNLLLIHFYDASGAALAMLVTEITVLIYMMINYTKIVRIFLGNYIPKPIAASLIMAIITYFLRRYFILSVLLSCAIYPLTFWILRGINSSDVETLKNYVKVKD